MSRPIPSGWAVVPWSVEEVSAMPLGAWLAEQGDEEDVSDAPTVRVVMAPVVKAREPVARDWVDAWLAGGVE